MFTHIRTSGGRTVIADLDTFMTALQVVLTGRIIPRCVSSPGEGRIANRR